MAFSSTLVMCALALTACSGRRIAQRAAPKPKMDPSFVEVKMQSQCPDEVELSKKGDCVDPHQVAVDKACCAHLDECATKIKSDIKVLRGRIRSYMKTCSVSFKDLRRGQDGKFAMAEPHKLCSEECQGTEELATPHVVDLDSLEQKCGDEMDGFGTLSGTVAMMDALDAAWKKCEEGGHPEPPSTPEKEEDLPDIFSPIEKKNTVFVIDRTRAMLDTGCPDQDRYEFVTTMLTNKIMALPESSKFNVVVFDKDATALFDEPMLAEKRSKERFIQFMDTNRPRGFMTRLFEGFTVDLEKALTMAFEMPEVDDIHVVLADLPSKGVTAQQVLKSRPDRLANVPVNTAFFRPEPKPNALTGWWKDRTGVSSKTYFAVELLRSLARTTGGTFIDPYPHVPETCPPRLRHRITIKDFAEVLDGQWVQDGAHSGKARYRKESTFEDALGGHDYFIEWSNKRKAWRAYRDNFAHVNRETLYTSDVDSVSVPHEGWTNEAGETPVPVVVEDTFVAE